MPPSKELTKSSLRDKWSEHVITLNNAYTKSLTLTKDALDCLRFHAYTKDELLAIAHLRDNLHDLKDAKYSYINMQRKNYKFEYNGKVYELKTEVLRKKSNKHRTLQEIPYSLKEK